MRRYSPRSSTYWSAGAPGGRCRRVSGCRNRPCTGASRSGREPACGADSTRRSCTGWTTPASSTSPASCWTPRTCGQKRGPPHTSEPRGPRQAGFQDAHLVGRERTAPRGRDLRRQRPRQPRPEAHDHGSPNETRPAPRTLLQAPAPPRRQSLRHPSPAEMVMGQAHRRPHRPQGHRVQRTIRAPEVGHRADDVVADRLPPTQRPHYERQPSNCLAFLGLAASLSCYKRLLKLTM